MNTSIINVQTREQIRVVASIAKEVWHEYYSSILSSGQIDYMVDKFQSENAIECQVENDGYRYFLLQVQDGDVSSQEGCDAGNLKSMFAGYFAIKPYNGKLFLSKFYILQQYRGKGVASAGFDFMEQTARREKLESIWLTVNKGNDNSMAVYNHKGFKTVREQVADIGNGYIMDDYIMEKSM